MERYIVRDAEAGNVIEKAETMEEALDIIACYEEYDKAEGTYTPNFYEVVEAEVEQVLFIEGNRNGYHPEQCGRTLTVNELIDYLTQFDGDMKVYLRNDNGYTYGSITESDFGEGYVTTDEVELAD